MVLVVVLAACGLFAGQGKMVVHETNGDTAIFDLVDVVQITFENLTALSGRADLVRRLEMAVSDILPNPFATAGFVQFDVASGGLVTVDVLTTDGRFVVNLHEGELSAGRHGVARGKAGTLPGGVYLLRVTEPGQVNSYRLLLTEKQRGQ